MWLKSLHIADLLKLNSALIAVLIFVVVSLTVRLMFEPTIWLAELPYSEFQEKLQGGGASSIVRLDLQADLTDFWGRDIAKVLLTDSPNFRYMLVPPNFYGRMCEDCRRRKYSFQCVNVCMDCTPLIQITLAYVCSFVLILAVLILKRRHRTKVT